MYKLTIVVSLLLLAVAAGYAQTQPERRVIEVSGSAERLITPNEFTFKIMLVERIENKQKITIEQQEASLRASFQILVSMFQKIFRFLIFRRVISGRKRSRTF